MKLLAILALFVVVIATVFQPWLLVVPAFLLLQPQLRKGARGAITAWLDRFQTR